MYNIYIYTISILRYNPTFAYMILFSIPQQVMKQNKLGTFDLTQIAGGPLGNFAQQALFGETGDTININGRMMRMG